MKNSKSIYHNEIIGALSIASVLTHGKISSEKAVLILPFLFHKETLDYLYETNVRSINTLSSTKSNLIANFNKRYYSLLTVSLNSILIGKQLKLFDYQNGMLIIENEDFDYTNFGNRLLKIHKASSVLSNLLSAPSNELYFNLQIKL